MALINCPECNHEMSDSVSNCPHCGYVYKKSKKGGKVVAMLLVLVLLVVAGGAAYMLVLYPNQKLTQAQNLIERGKYDEAENVLASLKASERKTELQNAITLYEVETYLENGDFASAEKKLAMLPADKIDGELKTQISIQRAISLMVQGKYEDADAILQKEPANEEVTLLKEQLSYESRIFNCTKAIKKVLKNPDSLSVYEITFYKDEVKDAEASTEDNAVYKETEPACVMHYGAQNGFGGNTTSYALFKWDEEDANYALYGTVDSLDEEDLDEDDDDYWYEWLVQIMINGFMEDEAIGTFDMERVQTLLKNNAYTTIKIIK